MSKLSRLAAVAAVTPLSVAVLSAPVYATNHSQSSNQKKTESKHDKDCPKEEHKDPVYACKMLTVTLGVDRSVSASVTFVAENGATLKSVSYDFGDGSPAVVTNGSAASHTYAKDGTYKVVSTLTFNVGEKTKTSACSVDVTIKLPETPQTQPATTTLPNTGVGSVAGLFAGVTGLSAVGHAIVRRRR